MTDTHTYIYDAHMHTYIYDAHIHTYIYDAHMHTYVSLMNTKSQAATKDKTTRRCFGGRKNNNGINPGRANHLVNVKRRRVWALLA